MLALYPHSPLNEASSALPSSISIEPVAERKILMKNISATPAKAREPVLQCLQVGLIVSPGLSMCKNSKSQMQEQTAVLKSAPSEPEKRPLRALYSFFRTRLPWTLAGLALALLVVLVLPTAQINLGAKTLQGLVGTYTDPGGDHWDISYAYNGNFDGTITNTDGTTTPVHRAWTGAQGTDGGLTISDVGQSATGTSTGTITATLT